ncbi:hypothetical protein [Thermoanaerobacterium sp. RBIITD]|uniref:hypothetical protein n=1 Tax=Thermoanaerobacterium sp. RBIITD TaxID=1550240 RepID=UPI000BB6C216|nr:hypothetical protein [Thermoanaerobacterium sp. RBIITD]SNX55070.1 hypothetical protein SAMN05660242_2857 [Thermoanaerobacterium sp. RBIITD]
MEEQILSLLNKVLAGQEEIKQEIVTLNVKVDNLAKRMDKVEQRLDKVEQRLDKVEQRLDKVEQRLDKVEQRLDKVEQRLDAVEKDISKIKFDIEGIKGDIAVMKEWQDVHEEITKKEFDEFRQEVNDRFTLLEASIEKINVMPEEFIEETKLSMNSLCTMYGKHELEINNMKQRMAS